MTLRRGVLALGLVLSLSGAGAAFGVAAGPVVPSGGKVAGKTYSQWLGAFWQKLLQDAPTAPACRTISGVRATFSTPNGKTVTCSVPGGRIYLDGPSDECSTVEKAPYHAITNRGLKACARRNFHADVKNVQATLEGKAVRFVTAASSVFRFHLPKNNVLGVKKRDGRSAAYGPGLLLRGLKPGVHVFRGRATFGGKAGSVVYRLRVR